MKNCFFLAVVGKYTLHFMRNYQMMLMETVYFSARKKRNSNPTHQTTKLQTVLFPFFCFTNHPQKIQIWFLVFFFSKFFLTLWFYLHYILLNKSNIFCFVFLCLRFYLQIVFLGREITEPDALIVLKICEISIELKLT